MTNKVKEFSRSFEHQYSSKQIGTHHRIVCIVDHGISWI